VAAPVVQTGIYHAKVNPRSYMYVFAHNSEAGEYAHVSIFFFIFVFFDAKIYLDDCQIICFLQIYSQVVTKYCR